MSAAVSVLFGTITGLLPNLVYVRMVDRDPADYLFLLATAVFAGAFVSQRSLAAEPIGDRFADGGLVSGFLAVGCPICNVGLVALFGSSELMTCFDPLRSVLGAVSVVFFVALLPSQHRRCEPCRPSGRWFRCPKHTYATRVNHDR